MRMKSIVLLGLAAALVSAAAAHASTYTLWVPQLTGTGAFGAVDNLQIGLNATNPVATIPAPPPNPSVDLVNPPHTTSYSLGVLAPGTYTYYPGGYTINANPDNLITTDGVDGISNNGLILGLYSGGVLTYDLLLRYISPTQIDFALWSPTDTSTVDTGVYNPIATPEPGTMLLLGSGALLVGLVLMRKMKSNGTFQSGAMLTSGF